MFWEELKIFLTFGYGMNVVEERIRT